MSSEQSVYPAFYPISEPAPAEVTPVASRRRPRNAPTAFSVPVSNTDNTLAMFAPPVVAAPVAAPVAPVAPVEPVAPVAPVPTNPNDLKMKNLLTQLRNDCNNALSAQITYNHILNVIDSFKNFHEFVNATGTVGAAVTPNTKITTTPVFTQKVYSEFAKEMRTRLMKENPSWTATEVISEIGRQWVLHTGQPQSSNLVVTPNRQHDPLPTPNNKPVAPKPVAPKPVAPKPVVQQPVTPQLNLLQAPIATQVGPKPPVSNAMRYPIFAKDMTRWIDKTHPDWSAEKTTAEIVQMWNNHKKVMGIVPTNKEDLEIEARLATLL